MNEKSQVERIIKNLNLSEPTIENILKITLLIALTDSLTQCPILSIKDKSDVLTELAMAYSEVAASK